jgi:hypothetical protein
MQSSTGSAVRTLLMVFLISLSLWLSGCSSDGYNSYTRWLSTTVAGCDPVQLNQGICVPRKGSTP